MSALKSSDNATRKVITHQHQFLKSTCMASFKNFRPLESNIQLPNSTDSITISHLFTSIQDKHNNCLFHAVVSHRHRKDQIMVALTRSSSVHIRAVQQDALSFLQISYPWLNAEDIFLNVDETTTLLQQIKDFNISQAAQADTMIKELFLEWDKFPPLSEDDYSQGNPKQGGWKNDPSPLTSQAHCTSHPPSSRFSTHRALLKKKARSRTTEAFSDSDLSNSADSYSTHRSCCHSVKLNITTSVLTPITTLEVQPVHPQEACQRPLTTQCDTILPITKVIWHSNTY